MKRIYILLSILISGGSLFAQDASFPIEANAGYIDFNSDSEFRDAWYVGGATGFDFTENAGIRGYYWRALDDGQIDDLDNLEIYGAETKVKIPITETVKPYLVVGGGLLKPYGDYEPADTTIVDIGDADDTFFGSAGVGLDLKFIRFLSVTGYARAMISEFDQLNDVGEEESDINSSWNYGASINFNIGDNKKKKESDTEIVMPAEKKTEMQIEEYEKDKKIEDLEERIEELEKEKERQELRDEIREDLLREYDLEPRSKKKVVDEEVEYVITDSSSQNPLMIQMNQLNRKMDSLARAQEELSNRTQANINELSAQQQEQLDSIQNQLDVARQQRNELDENRADYESAKAELDQQIEALENQQSELQSTYTSEIERLENEIRMANTAAEREFAELRKEQYENNQTIESQLDRAIERRESLNTTSPDYDEMRSLLDENIELLQDQQERTNRRYERELRAMERELERTRDDQDDIRDDFEETREQFLDRDYLIELQDEMSEEEYRSYVKDVEITEDDDVFDRMIYSHSDAFIGAGFGTDDYGAFLLGARPNYYFAGSSVYVSPEVSIGVGEETTFSLMGNTLFDLNIENSSVEPYLGLGIGFMTPNGDFKPAYNMIFGSELNSVMDGKLNVEFAGRNLFKYNQLTIGYEVF